MGGWDIRWRDRGGVRYGNRRGKWGWRGGEAGKERAGRAGMKQRIAVVVSRNGRRLGGAADMADKVCVSRMLCHKHTEGTDDG